MSIIGDIIEETEVKPLEDRIQKALEIARTYGCIDGAHHKMWTIDQMVRALTGCPMVKDVATSSHGTKYTYERQGESAEYNEWVAETKNGEDGPETYMWEKGTPP